VATAVGGEGGTATGEGSARPSSPCGKAERRPPRPVEEAVCGGGGASAVERPNPPPAARPSSANEDSDGRHPREPLLADGSSGTRRALLGGCRSRRRRGVRRCRPRGVRRIGGRGGRRRPASQRGRQLRRRRGGRRRRGQRRADRGRERSANRDPRGGWADSVPPPHWFQSGTRGASRPERDTGTGDGSTIGRAPAVATPTSSAYRLALKAVSPSTMAGGGARVRGTGGSLATTASARYVAAGSCGDWRGRRRPQIDFLLPPSPPTATTDTDRACHPPQISDALPPPQSPRLGKKQRESWAPTGVASTVALAATTACCRRRRGHSRPVAEPVQCTGRLHQHCQRVRARHAP